MKNCISALFLLIVTISLVNCDSAGDGPLTRDEVLKKLTEEVREDATIVDDVISEGTIITGENYDAIGTFNTRNSFIAFMQGKAAGPIVKVFDGYTDNPSVMPSGWPMRAGAKVKNYLAYYPVGYEGANPGSGLLDLWWNEIGDSIQRKAQGKQIVIESFTFSGPSTPSTPVEEITTSYSRVAVLANNLKQIVLSSTTTSTTEIDRQINDLIATLPPDEVVFIGLLLPAVQKIRQGNPVFDNFLNASTPGLDPAKRKVFVRDLQLCALYAGVDYIICKDYDSKDHHVAALSVIYQMQQAVMTMAWAKGYDGR